MTEENLLLLTCLRSPAAAAVSVKQVPESGGLTLRMRSHRCKSCKLSFSGATEAAAHKASNRHRYARRIPDNIGTGFL